MCYSLPILSNNHLQIYDSNDSTKCSSDVIKCIVNDIFQNLYSKPHSNINCNDIFEYSLLSAIFSVFYNYYTTIIGNEIDWKDVDFSNLSKKYKSLMRISVYYLSRSIKRYTNINLTHEIRTWRKTKTNSKRKKKCNNRYSSPSHTLQCVIYEYIDILFHIYRFY